MIIHFFNPPVNTDMDFISQPYSINPKVVSSEKRYDILEKVYQQTNDHKLGYKYAYNVF